MMADLTLELIGIYLKIWIEEKQRYSKRNEKAVHQTIFEQEEQQAIR